MTTHNRKRTPAERRVAKTIEVAIYLALLFCVSFLWWHEASAESALWRCIAEDEGDPIELMVSSTNRIIAFDVDGKQLWSQMFERYDAELDGGGEGRSLVYEVDGYIFMFVQYYDAAGRYHDTKFLLTKDKTTVMWRCK